jgi:hypothetical protein
MGQKEKIVYGPAQARDASPSLYRRKLNLNAKFEAGASYYSFKRLLPGGSKWV